MPAPTRVWMIYPELPAGGEQITMTGYTTELDAQNAAVRKAISENRNWLILEATDYASPEINSTIRNAAVLPIP